MLLIGRAALGSGLKNDNRYKILDFSGSAGMGTVFSASELSLLRKVAIKFVHRGLLSSEENLPRFQREGKILSQFLEPRAGPC